MSDQTILKQPHDLVNPMTQDSPPLQTTSTPKSPAPERTDLERLVEALVLEYRKDRGRRRRFRLWGLLFVLGICGATLGWIGLSPTDHPARFTAVVEVSGLIGLDHGNMAQDLESRFLDAFNADGTKGVVALINSPGGSPVQSGQLYRALRELKREYPETPLLAVISDIGASGAYYIAAAADEIYVDPASIVGSIGVVSSGFGFVDTLDKLGIERRLITAGDHKAMLDPFSPADPVDQRIIQGIIDDIHAQFIAAVEEGRGARLQADADLFSGRVWSGREAVRLGLADGTASLTEVARQILDAPTIVDFSIQPDWRSVVLEQLGASIVGAMGLADTTVR
ncbi:MAG TPA: S49 family peptidase [Gammaproteobacteria bacterium]|nr:S49 family peptidase [Gammaproteobacteria bacterium]